MAPTPLRPHMRRPRRARHPTQREVSPPQRFRLRHRLIQAIVGHMVDLKLQVPATDEVEVDSQILAAIDWGIEAAEEGRSVPLEEVRKMIPKWISRFESQTRRI